MRTIELNPPAQTEQFVVNLANELGLLARVQSLAAYPGSLHWHLRKEGQKGTLEVTFSPPKRRMWLSVHSNRDAEWIEEAIQRFIERFGVRPTIQ